MATAEAKMSEQKRVSITSKRQLTIPQIFYNELGFGREAICSIQDGRLVIEPFNNVVSGGEFAEFILADLVAEGLSGNDLLNEFHNRQTKVRPAVEAMLEEAKKAAGGEGDYSTYEDVFATEE